MVDDRRFATKLEFAEDFDLGLALPEFSTSFQQVIDMQASVY